MQRRGKGGGPLRSGGEERAKEKEKEREKKGIIKVQRAPPVFFVLPLSLSLPRPLSSAPSRCWASAASSTAEGEPLPTAAGALDVATSLPAMTAGGGVLCVRNAKLLPKKGEGEKDRPGGEGEEAAALRRAACRVRAHMCVRVCVHAGRAAEGDEGGGERERRKPDTQQEKRKRPYQRTPADALPPPLYSRLLADRADRAAHNTRGTRRRRHMPLSRRSTAQSGPRRKGRRKCGLQPVLISVFPPKFEGVTFLLRILRCLFLPLPLSLLRRRPPAA